VVFFCAIILYHLPPLVKSSPPGSFFKVFFFFLLALSDGQISSFSPLNCIIHVMYIRPRENNKMTKPTQQQFSPRRPFSPDFRFSLLLISVCNCCHLGNIPPKSGALFFFSYNFFFQCLENNALPRPMFFFSSYCRQTLYRQSQHLKGY